MNKSERYTSLDKKSKKSRYKYVVIGKSRKKLPDRYFMNLSYLDKLSGKIKRISKEYPSERAAALAVDKKLLELGKNAVNILKPL